MLEYFYLLFYDPLVKWFNTPPSQGGIRGFETHTGYQNVMKRISKLDFRFFYKKNLYIYPLGVYNILR